VNGDIAIACGFGRLGRLGRIGSPSSGRAYWASSEILGAVMLVRPPWRPDSFTEQQLMAHPVICRRPSFVLIVCVCVCVFTRVLVGTVLASLAGHGFT